MEDMILKARADYKENVTVTIGGAKVTGDVIAYHSSSMEDWNEIIKVTESDEGGFLGGYLLCNRLGTYSYEGEDDGYYGFERAWLYSSRLEAIITMSCFALGIVTEMPETLHCEFPEKMIELPDEFTVTINGTATVPVSGEAKINVGKMLNRLDDSVVEELKKAYSKGNNGTVESIISDYLDDYSDDEIDAESFCEYNALWSSWNMGFDYENCDYEG